MNFSHNAERVWIYAEPIHMGKAFVGLTKIIEDELGKRVESGDMFLFTNKKQTYVKILWSMSGSACIFAKKLMMGHFAIPDKAKISLESMERILEDVLMAEMPTEAAVAVKR